MDKVYYTIFFLALPIMCLLSYFVVTVIWFFGKRREEAKRVFIVGAIGGFVGYLIALIYFYLTRDGTLISIAELSYIGFLVGAGYTTILFSLLPKKLRLKGLVGEQ